jgi:hypothetical protein
MNDPTFLLVRHAEGSAGTFLLSVLSCSESIAHCDSLVEHNKTEENCLGYMYARYSTDVKNWLLREPKPKEVINFHFISTKFDRGNNLSTTEFMDLCRSEATPYFWEAVDLNKRIALTWHKKYIPEYFNTPIVVTIIIDKESEHWYHRALWYKKYGIKNGKIHVKADDPVYNPNRAIYFTQFKNPYLLDIHPYTFIKNNIIRSTEKELFSDPANFSSTPNQQFILLSELLNEDRFVNAVDRICITSKLNPISETIVRASQKHWISCHEY